MDWKTLLKMQAEEAYAVTANLMKMVTDGELAWKPSEGQNWMTTGQLLKHLSEACGFCCRGFVTGDWGVNVEALSPEEMLPPAEKMPSVSSVEEALRLLQADRVLTLQMLDRVDEARLDTEPTPAPWDPSTPVLGVRLLQMINHLSGHRTQLFYYLKLQGKAVNTWHLHSPDAVLM